MGHNSRVNYLPTTNAAAVRSGDMHHLVATICIMEACVSRTGDGKKGGQTRNIVKIVGSEESDVP